jgi:hypothetical protein
MADPLIALNSIEELLIEWPAVDHLKMLDLLKDIQQQLLASELPLYNVLHSHVSALPMAGEQLWLLRTLSLSLISELQLLLALR